MGITEEATSSPLIAMDVDGLQMFTNHERNDDENNLNENHHSYYNARYPPRRGRYSRNMDHGVNAKVAYYWPKHQYQWNNKGQTMWKRKEKKIEHQIKVE